MAESLAGSVNEMSVRFVAAAETFCTIMSRLVSASASASKMRAASPTLSGTPTTVIFASLRSCATPAMIACSISVPSSIVLGSAIHVPVLVENEDRTWIGRLKRRAYSTHRRWRIFAPQAAISSISSYEMRSRR